MKIMDTTMIVPMLAAHLSDVRQMLQFLSLKLQVVLNLLVLWVSYTWKETRFSLAALHNYPSSYMAVNSVQFTVSISPFSEFH